MDFLLKPNIFSVVARVTRTKCVRAHVIRTEEEIAGVELKEECAHEASARRSSHVFLRSEVKYVRSRETQ